MSRRAITNEVSSSGTNSTTSGKPTATAAAVFSTPITETDASTNPIVIEPASPMNTRAGWKLRRRKPMQAPASAATTSAGCTRPSESASTQNVPDEIAPMPAARPSMPSMKLRTFISPTIQTIVSGYCNTPVENGERKGSVTWSMLTPAATGTAATPIWAASLAATGRSKTSSAKPTSAHRMAPARIARIGCDRWSASTSTGTTAPTSRARPAAERDDALVHPAATRPVDCTEASCDSRSRPVQQERECDPEGERFEGELRAVVHVTPL